jgi:hypothetical protein
MRTSTNSTRYKAHDHIKITSWEREVNHIATGRALSPGENYSLLIIGDSKVDGDGGEIDGDGGDGDGDR